MINNILISFFLCFYSIFLCSCQETPSKNEKLGLLNNHIGTSSLYFVLAIYKDKHNAFPDGLASIEDAYKKGETGLGLDSVTIMNLIMDPFSNQYLRYHLINDSSYILYSVGPNELDDNYSKIIELIDSNKIEELDFNKYSEGKNTGNVLISFVLDSKIVEY